MSAGYHFLIIYLGFVMASLRFMQKKRLIPLLSRGVVRFQSNIDKHDPEVCYKNVSKWEKDEPCKELPKFVPFGMNVSAVIQ